MKIDTITLITSGLLLLGALVMLFAGRLRRRRLLGRQRMNDLLRSYFQGDLPPDQLGPRAREAVGRHFTQSDQFYSLVVSAFQNAIDTTLTRSAGTQQEERRLMVAMAALKNEFGLTDRYQVEAWRPWRE